MTKEETIAAFPIGTIVHTDDDRIGKVTDHMEYVLAFVGRRTFMEVTSTETGRVMGEYASSNLTVIRP